MTLVERLPLGRRRRRALGLCAFAFLGVPGLAACLPSASARLGETAGDYLVHLRFGRMGVLGGYEVPESRRKLAGLHATLGVDRQLTDADILAVQVHGDTAQVVAKLGWYAPGELIVRSSVVEQRWVKAGAGGWLLEDESVTGGDTQLFVPPKPQERVEGATPLPANTLGKGAHFPSVRIGD